MAGTMIGRTFSGRYRIVERIGIGGMAEVYRAQDTVLGRIVAVKVMLPQYAADAEFTRRFRQEAASAANLQSPYIVNVYDWGQDEGTYYIVMEYIRGSDLKTAIKERGAINQRKVAEIASQSCQALSVAHHMDIVHRDVKPQNIMVQPDGNVKMMDFGIARAKNSVKSQTSSVLGTAHYISPEQAQGKELTAASDIYSLGVCMYEAITGELPFDGPDAVSVAMKQVNEQPKPLHDIFPGVDPVLEAIVLRAMAKNPAQRFSTALEMRQILNDYLAGRARGKAAADAILAGAAGLAAAGAVMGAHANDVTRVMNGTAAAQQTTALMNDIPTVTPTQTQVMNPANSQQIPQVWAQQGTGANVPLQNMGYQQGTGAHIPIQNPGYNDNTNKKKSGKGRTVAIVLLLLVLVVAGAAVAYTMLQGPKTVPDVTGKTLEQARQILDEDGYTVGTTTEVFSDKVEAGKVISSDPAAGKTAEKGTSVSLTISKGIEQVDVPDIINIPEAEAKQALKNSGLTGKAGTSEHSMTVEKGNIISMNPAAGTTVNKGSSVTYIVSLGPETVQVPNVTGQSLETATTNLVNAGFNVSVLEDYSNTVAEGHIISQNPSSGERVNKESTVEIVVSLGEEKVYVPDVVGYTVGDAWAVLENAGFNVSESSSYSNSAIVTSQSLSGEAKAGSTVNITATEPKPSSSSSGGGSSSSSTASSDDDDDDDESDSGSSSSSSSS